MLTNAPVQPKVESCHDDTRAQQHSLPMEDPYMLLNLLWRGRCHAMPTIPLGLAPYLQSFGFPLLTLGCQEGDGRTHIHFADDFLLPGLSLADALCCELDVLVPDDAAILVLPNRVSGPQLAGDLLYAVLSRTPWQDQAIPGLFDWAYRSLAEAWRQEYPLESRFQSDRDQVLHAVLDYPAGRAELGLAAYLNLLDPDYHAQPADQDLAERLARVTSLTEWNAQLRDSFDATRCRRAVT